MAYHRLPDLPKDFALLVETCRAAFARPDGRDAPRPPRDWRPFLALVDRHRVPGLAARGLERLALEVPAPLAERARSSAGDNLRAAEWSARIDQSFAAAGLDRLWLKGLTLSALAYGDPFVKMSADIDLLVAPGRVGDAERLLAELGYVPAEARRKPLLKDRLWQQAGAPPVDLHCRFTDNPRLAAGIGLASPRQRVTIAPGIALDTLGSEILFSYLAAHGASSLWFRLKWIADFAAFWETAAVSAIDSSRATVQATALANLLFGSPTIPGVDRAARRPGNRLFIRLALRQLVRPAEPTQTRLGTMPIHLAQLLIGDSPGFAASEALRQLRAAVRR